MTEKGSQTKRERLISFVKEQMVRPEYMRSPSARLVHNFCLSLLDISGEGDDDYTDGVDAIVSGGTYTAYIGSKSGLCSDDGTPEGIRREILRMLDRHIEKGEPRDRIFTTFIRNALHIGRGERGCIQVDIVKEKDNEYAVTLRIAFPSGEPEHVPLSREAEAEIWLPSGATGSAIPDQPPPRRALRSRKATPTGTVARSEERGSYRPVKDRLAQIVQARLAFCEQEAECDKELLGEAAECAVALEDRNAAERLFERVWDKKISDIVTIARLALLIGHKAFALKAIEYLEITEDGEEERLDEAALIAAAIPEPEVVERLIPKLETRGLILPAAIAAAKIGDNKSAVRMMQRAKERGFVTRDEKELFAFPILAPFDAQLAREIISSIESLSGRDDVDDLVVDFSLLEAGYIAMALEDRNAARRIAESLQKRDNDFFAAFLFGTLGELQVIQEVILEMEKDGDQFWKESYWTVPVDISRYNLEAGFEVLRLLKRREYDIAMPAMRILNNLHWMGE